MSYITDDMKYTKVLSVFDNEDIISYNLTCKNCEFTIHESNMLLSDLNYCPRCGEKIKWKKLDLLLKK